MTSEKWQLAPGRKATSITIPNSIMTMLVKPGMVLEGSSWSVYQGILVPVTNTLGLENPITVIPPIEPEKALESEPIVSSVSLDPVVQGMISASQSAPVPEPPPLVSEERVEAVEEIPTQPTIQPTIEASESETSEVTTGDSTESEQVNPIESTESVGAIAPKRGRFGRR